MRSPLSRNNVTLAGNQDAKKTLLFVNGLGTDHTAWSRVAPAFQDDYRLVLFDNVGSVQSNLSEFRGAQNRYLNVRGYALDLLEIIDAIHPSEPVIAVGHSLGAMACLLASIDRPEKFSRLVLLGASPRYKNADDYEGGFSKADIDATYSAIRSDYPAWSSALAAIAMANSDRPELAQRFAKTLASIPSDMMLTVLCSILQMDHRSALARVSVPVLLIQSQKDYFVPMGVATYLHTNIRNSKLKLINAEGHLPHISAPECIVAAIRDFISGT